MKFTKWTIGGLAALGLAVMLAAVWPVQSADNLRLPGAVGTLQSVVTSGAGEMYSRITNNTYCTMTNALIMCQGGKDVAIAWRAQLDAAGTTANTLGIEESADGSTWELLTVLSMTPAADTAVVVVTNLTIGASPYLRVAAITNANANTGYMTNCTVKAFVK